MSSKRLYLILLGVIGLLAIGLIGVTYSASNLLSKQAIDLTAAKAKSMALDQEQLTLAKAKKDIQTYSGLEKIAQSVVPEDKNQAEAVREIVNIASANDVSLASITFPASSLGTTANGLPAPASPAPAAGASSSSKTGGLSQLQPVKNISHVYQLTITIQSDQNKPVQYDKFISFLTALEHNRRTAQVSSITLQPNLNNHAFLSFTLSLNEYIKP